MNAVSWVAVASAIVSAVGAIIVAIVTNRSHERATVRTAAVAEKTAETDRLDRFAHRLAERLEVVENDLAEERAARQRVEADLAEERSARMQLAEDLHDCRLQLHQHKTLLGKFVEYSRTLRRTLRVYAVDVPEPPRELHEHM